MKATLISFAFIIILSACSEKPVIDLTAGNLRLAIDKTGKIIALEDVTSGTNYIASGESSYLVECLKYDADSLKTMMHPSSMTIIKESNADIEAELLYEEGIKITLNITPKEGYFRMELREIEPVSKVSQIVWGPYKTIMRGQIGEWLGLNRSNDFTIGLFPQIIT